jgi:hypothetical protein
VFFRLFFVPGQSEVGHPLTYSSDESSEKKDHTHILFATHVDERETAVEKDFARVQAKVETELFIIDGLIAPQKLQGDRRQKLELNATGYRSKRKLYQSRVVKIGAGFAVPAKQEV